MLHALVAGCAIPAEPEPAADDGGLAAEIAGPDEGPRGADGADGGGVERPPARVEFVAGVIVSTLAGSGVPGADDGQGAGARFDNPVNVARGADGALLVADFEQGRLRHVAADATVTTWLVRPGFVRPFGLAFAGSALFVQTDASSTGEVGAGGGSVWRIDGPGAATPVAEALGRPRGLVGLADGRLVLVDPTLHAIRLLDPSAGTIRELAGAPGTPGFADGQGADARFDRPYGAAALPDGRIVVADERNHRLRIVTLQGAVTTLAGDGTPAMTDGPLAQARFGFPRDVAVDTAGDIVVSDSGNHRVRVVEGAERVRTLAGDGEAGFADGDGRAARFFAQEGLDVTPDGRVVFVADGTGGEPLPYHRIRRIGVPAP